jgi:molecular chaperone GrpE
MSKKGRHDGIEDSAVQPTEISAEEKGNELQSCIERLQRLQAEFENYKKRTARDIATLEERVADQVILDFLTPYENLERAFRSYASDQDVEPFVAGVEQIFAQFAQILEQRGVERIPAVGDPFDPALHEALLTAPSGEEKNTIIEEFSPGYRRHGRVLRVSRVTVSQGPAAQEEQA